jgi:uncharacterized Zn-binding protein involved in type VI secretion
MPEAARLGDLIGHAPPIPPVVAAAVAGGAVASGAAGTVGGGLTSAANAGADAASGASGRGGSGVGGVVTGKIIGPCSGNVFINGIPAARALVDQSICSLHPLVPLPIVSGSSNVFINGLPAARLGDRIFCGAIILSGSGNVFIGGSAGGESVSTDMAMPEGSISPLQCDGILMADAGATNLFGGPADSPYMQWRATAAAPFKAGNLQSQLVPIGRVESFFMFHPVGRFMKGWSAGVLDIGNLQRNVVLREWSHVVDEYGYAKQALFGPEKGVMGDVWSYQPKSVIFKSVEQTGIANTAGAMFHDAIMDATSLSTMQALGSRDPEAIGKAGAGILLPLAGGSLIARGALPYNGTANASKMAFETRGFKPEGLDPYLLKNFGQILSTDPVANAALRQMQGIQGKSGGQALLHFGDGPPGLAGRVTQVIGRAPNIEMFMNNGSNISARGAAGTYVHESSHFTRAARGFEIGTQLDEYAAFRREALFELGRRPTLLEKRNLWSEKIQNDPFYNGRPVGGELPTILRGSGN